MLLGAALLLFAQVAEAHAIPRDEVIARAQRWVDLGVPYSQSSYFEGYRQDCSGFVSMAWRLTWPNGTPRSLATDTLPGVCIPITKDDLQPGDAIIRPKTPDCWGHAVIFGGWTSDARTHYWALEESGSHGGARIRETPYPFWSSSGGGFAPYRYVGITESWADVLASIAGANRYATAAAASARAFADPSAVDAVVIATGEAWPDALGGASLAGALGGPVLLTARDWLPAEIRSEIERLAPERAVVLGGEAAVSEGVVRAIEGLGVSVERISGPDRYTTSAAVASATVAAATAGDASWERVAYVATGADFPDALAVSPVAGFRARPVLLAEPSTLPTVTADALTELDFDRAFVVGGESAVSAEAYGAVAQRVPQVSRLSGPDRYRTALAVVGHGVSTGLTREGAGLATGVSFADALAGGAAQGLSAPGSVLYLTSDVRLPHAVGVEIGAHRETIGMMRVYGGVAAVPDAVRVQAAAAMRGW